VDGFSSNGSHLERYARRLTAVEINSSFYRPHKPATYARWAASVPDGFKFAVKIPKAVTHATRLTDHAALKKFLSEIAPLGATLGPLLVQLPPSLAHDENNVTHFFDELRSLHNGDVVVEPRHESWFRPEVENMLVARRIARVAADPTRGLTNASVPGGWPGLAYFRLHGSPRIYYSEYSEEYLTGLSDRLLDMSQTRSVWCIFDNTALGFALKNALRLVDKLNLCSNFMTLQE
jgi:uncharacterized protein YecE (DUF72 family)